MSKIFLLPSAIPTIILRLISCLYHSPQKKRFQCIIHSFVFLLELLSILSHQSDLIMRLGFPCKFSRLKLKVNTFSEFCRFVRNGLKQHFTPYCSNSGSEYETCIWGSGNSKRVCKRVMLIISGRRRNS